LTAGGAKRDHYLSEMVTYAIADDASEPDYMEAKELFELPVVTVSLCQGVHIGPVLYHSASHSIYFIDLKA